MERNEGTFYSESYDRIVLDCVARLVPRERTGLISFTVESIGTGPYCLLGFHPNILGGLGVSAQPAVLTYICFRMVKELGSSS